jgi:hypothetical protein
MNERPVLLFTFANQQDAYLPKLKEESETLNDVFSALHDKGLVEVQREESVTVDQLSKSLVRFRDRIALFHYGGHAEGERLHFEGGGGNAEGIAQLLGQLPKLQVVFLNGCSTQPQVDQLLAAGVKAVIATAVPIDDSKAVEFARFFYMSLAYHNSVQDAFNFAVGSLRNKYGGLFRAVIVRKGEAAPANPQQTQFMPWALFLNSDAAVLDYRLPHQVYTPPAPPTNYAVNEYILSILDAMLEADPKLEEALVRSDGEPIDEREELAMVIENFPWPIGAQLRLLATKDEGMDTTSVERVKQLVSTYIVTGQFLFYTVLSLIWESKRHKEFRIKSSITNALFLDDRSLQSFNFFEQMVQGVELLNSEGVALTVPELKDFAEKFNKDPELSGACQYMESLRYRIQQQDWAKIEQEKYSLCANGEKYLSVILSALAFLVNYDLITIRDIYVENYRYMKAKFNHYIGRLNVKVGDLTIGRSPTRPRSFEDFANNSSVILTSDMNDLSKFLNLSPFIIDKNAFGTGMTEDKATEQQLYMYACRQENEFKYFTTQHNIFRAQERTTDQLITTAEAEVRNPRLQRRIQREEAPPNPLLILRELFQLLERDLL